MSETNRFCFATITIGVIFACFLLVAPAQTAHAQSGVGDLGKKILSVLGGEGSLGTIVTAVVIGASIGAKNTIYDYLSGMILVLERPVWVNDCVEVDKEQGIVTEDRLLVSKSDKHLTKH